LKYFNISVYFEKFEPIHIYGIAIEREYFGKSNLPEAIKYFEMSSVLENSKGM
jgi:hypothetical protein